jgi:hypothetical protein
MYPTIHARFMTRNILFECVTEMNVSVKFFSALDAN